MTDKKYAWHKVADHMNEIDFATNNIAVVEVNNKKICLGKFNETVFAFAYKCPHAGGLLADGFIDNLGNVVCPLHRYKYDMKKWQKCNRGRILSKALARGYERKWSVCGNGGKNMAFWIK